MRTNHTPHDLGEEVARLAVQIDAAMHGLLTALRAFDAAEGWAHQGAVSCAHWLSWRVGWGLVTAREHVRVARRLGELPLLDAALARGEVSYSKVRALTRVATAANEALLLDFAHHGNASQLERICRSYAAMQRGQAQPPEHRRRVGRRELTDGLVRIEVDLPADEAALVMAAITGAARDASVEARRVDLADGVMQVAEAYLRGGNPERSPVELVVTVPASALTAQDSSDITDMGDLGDTPITPTTARRLACDAGVVAMAVDESGQTVDVGRRRRTIPAPIKRALLHRDRGCRFPGCTNKLFTHGHHIQHWADGGKTALPNLVTLCSRHHRFVHEHGWQVTMSADQQPTFHSPGGQPVRIQRPALPPWTPPDLTPPTPRWSGGAVDYNTCLEALEWRDRPPG